MNKTDNWDFMKSVLSRVLSEEIEHQIQWRDSAMEKDIPAMVVDRNRNIELIRQFMTENDITEYHY